MAIIVIANGANPRSSVLRNNFDFLAGGAGIKTGSTMEQLKTAAALAPTQPFTCIPTDIDALLLYCGKATRGPNADGFITLASFEEIV